MGYRLEELMAGLMGAMTDPLSDDKKAAFMENLFAQIKKYEDKFGAKGAEELEQAIIKGRVIEQLIQGGFTIQGYSSYKQDFSTLVKQAQNANPPTENPAPVEEVIQPRARRGQETPAQFQKPKKISLPKPMIGSNRKMAKAETGSNDYSGNKDTDTASSPSRDPVGSNNSSNSEAVSEEEVESPEQLKEKLAKLQGLANLGQKIATNVDETQEARSRSNSTFGDNKVAGLDEPRSRSNSTKQLSDNDAQIVIEFYKTTAGWNDNTPKEVAKAFYEHLKKVMGSENIDMLVALKSKDPQFEEFSQKYGSSGNLSAQAQEMLQKVVQNPKDDEAKQAFLRQAFIEIMQQTREPLGKFNATQKQNKTQEKTSRAPLLGGVFERVKDLARKNGEGKPGGPEVATRSKLGFGRNKGNE